MIEKMKFLNLTGPKEDIDRVVDTYLSKYEIHLENALFQLRTVHNLRPFSESNPYRNEWKRAEELTQQFSFQQQTIQEISLEQALNIVHSIDQTISDLNNQKQELEKEAETLTASLNQILPFQDLDYNVSHILEFKYIKFRFGRIAKEHYEKFESFIYDSIDTIMIKCQEDEHYIWIAYFVPGSVADKIDVIFASMHFERLFLPSQYEGTPAEACEELSMRITRTKNSIQKIEKKIAYTLEGERRDLAAAFKRLDRYAKNFDVRKLAACTNKGKQTFFIICGWMAEQDAAALKKEMEADKNLFLIIEDQSNNSSKPPTKLRNPKLFKPFELFVRMYGLPDYNEMDPTILIGLTYSFLFGFMFGDVGQGICLCIGGFLLYQIKHINLAAIVGCCGFFSTIFGFLFGSIFGFEDIIEAAWLRPGKAMTTLPFIGKLNTVFIITVALGMGIILLTMICNIINSLRVHQTEKAWFDTNGAAGFIFYLSMAVTIILFMSGKPLPAAAVMSVMFGLPLLLIFLKEPLTGLIEKKSAAIEGSKGMFFVQGFFELFEVLLSYFSNTVSFVRVGAFAVSHAAMMEVVLMLAGYESGNTNWIVVILGNLFVCGMEGLIVGIQVLRLEYYELFSRFYRGSGREFKAHGMNQ